MKNYKLTMELISDTIVGSAEGYGAIIDTDVVFDDLGIPYIPAKRIKGLLRNNAIEIAGILGLDIHIENLFGSKGETEKETPIKVSNLYVDDYSNNREHLFYYLKKSSLVTGDISGFFTCMRMQTAMEEENRVARNGSLRTSRVIKKGFTFHGELVFDPSFENLMGLACLNTRLIGSMRNRGFGEIKLSLRGDDDDDIINKALATYSKEEEVKV